MPKVGASLKDISTDYVLPEPAAYEFEIKEAKVNKVQETFEGNRVERTSVEIKQVIAEPGEHYGKPVYTNIHLNKKNGEPNPVALADLKRYFEAVAPEEAEADEPDTDALIGGRFRAECGIESYPGKDGLQKQKSSINARSIVSI